MSFERSLFLRHKTTNSAKSAKSAKSFSTGRPRSSVLKSFEATSQGYIELSCTSSTNHHNTTIYGLSNLFRHVDEGRYHFMHPTKQSSQSSPSSSAPVTVVCTSRVEMYVLRNDHMLKLIDYLKGTDAIRRLHELWYVGGSWCGCGCGCD